MKNKVLMNTRMKMKELMRKLAGSSLLVMFILSSGFSQSNEVVKMAEEMPRFPGCEEVIGTEAKKKCSLQKMMSFIGENLVYPAAAKKAGTEGMAVIKFVVTSEGNVDQVKIVKDPGNGCGDAAKAVVMMMNEMEEKWIPGMQDGEKVNVEYNLPVKFKLNDKKKASPPPPPPPPPPAGEEIFVVVEEMPFTKGCENDDKSAREACTGEKVAAFIIENLEYPEEAKKNNIEGKVIAQFVITNEGKMKKIQITKDIGGGCGAAAATVLEKMSQQDFWVSGKQRGRKVNVLYTLPFTFKAN